MSPTGRVVAVDLGATSGRVVLGSVAGGEVRLHEVARFANGPVRSGHHLRWDLTGLLAATLDGLAAALRLAPRACSVGVDSWAVDYALLRRGRRPADPFHYRDERCEAGVVATHRLIGPEELYARNGLQFLPFTTLYQLAVDRAEGRLQQADRLLLIPDLVMSLLGGSEVAERTNASTTGMLDVHSGQWETELVRELGITASLLPPLVDPGTPVGRLAPRVRARLGGAGAAVQLTTVASHDTASAVAAVPMRPERAAYISCGTWSLVGVELDAPVLTEQARAANFTNERGLDGRVRFLRNVMGLWLLDECVRSWQAAGEGATLAELLVAAEQLPGPVAVFDPDDPAFLTPGDMPARIAQHCRDHDLPVPSGPAQVARSILESLAEAFARAVHLAADLAGVGVETVHVVGGGARNEPLCQAIADRSGLPVMAGPVEATALGNVLVQARAAGLVSGDLESLRDLVSLTARTRRFRPRVAAGRAASGPTRGGGGHG